MTSLHNIKRASERITGARASIEYDENMGAYIEVSSEKDISLDKLDSVCEETGALMKVAEPNHLGENRYLFK